MGRFEFSRFANPFRTQTYTFGPCSCPGTPHEQDTAEVLVGISPSAKARIGRAELEGAVRLDPLAAHRQVIKEGVASWNLLWIDPALSEEEAATAVPVPVPINEATIELLQDLVPLAEWIDGLWSETDPNSVAPSRALRRGSSRRALKKTPVHGT